MRSAGRDGAGGVLWGLLAFKPTWAAAFLIVPLFTRRWRFLLAMTATGAGCVLATLPVVGVRPWLDWLQVGKEAAALYDVNRNWNVLSRDLQGIPRRLLLDFDKPEKDRGSPAARRIGWCLWCTVFAATAAVALTRVDRRRAVGVGAGFLFLGAYLGCYRFMYYDALLSAAGAGVLFASWDRFRRPMAFRFADDPRSLGYVSSLPLTLLVGLGLYENLFAAADLRATFAAGYWSHTAAGPAGAVTAMPRLEFDSTSSYPWDTYLLLALWAWCGVRLLMGEEGRAGRSTGEA